MKFVNFQPIVAQSVAANITSAPVDLNQIVKISAQVIVAAGTATGSFQLQVSNDICTYGNMSQNFVPTNWSNLGSPVAITTAGTSLIAQQDTCYRWIRAAYTNSGVGQTATLTVTLMCMSI